MRNAIYQANPFIDFIARFRRHRVRREIVNLVYDLKYFYIKTKNNIMEVRIRQFPRILRIKEDKSNISDTAASGYPSAI